MHCLHPLTDKLLPIDFWLGHHSLILLLLQQRKDKTVQDIHARCAPVPAHVYNCRLDLVNSARAQNVQVFEVRKRGKVYTRLI